MIWPRKAWEKEVAGPKNAWGLVGPRNLGLLEARFGMPKLLPWPAPTLNASLVPGYAGPPGSLDTCVGRLSALNPPCLPKTHQTTLPWNPEARKAASCIPRLSQCFPQCPMLP